jgi:hypothetical protein
MVGRLERAAADERALRPGELGAEQLRDALLRRGVALDAARRVDGQRPDDRAKAQRRRQRGALQQRREIAVEVAAATQPRRR